MRWVWLDTENSNFYYKITELNKRQLSHTISIVTGHKVDQVLDYLNEIESDIELRTYLEQAIKISRYNKDIKVDYGRRIGWYAFVRIMKPEVVVETGVDHGVGACIITSALMRNAQEGFLGKYYGTDIRPEAGQLFRGKYSTYGSIIYGDSIQSLTEFRNKIDIFINDSDHNFEYEYTEYLTIKDKLSKGGIILGDNSHDSSSLLRFSEENNRSYLFFSEKPFSHWYPGGGIGISF